MHDLDHDIRVWPLGIGGWIASLGMGLLAGAALRELAAEDDLAARRDHLARIEDHMGAQVTAKLKERITRMWTILKGADGAGEAPPAITPTAETEPSV